MPPESPHDPEFALLAAVTARPTGQRSAKDLTTAAAGQINWPRFVTLVVRHRIAPLAFDGLMRVRDIIPDDIHHSLRAAAMRDRASALQLVGILASIVARLSAAGIVAISFKGPTLAFLAFGDASLRQSCDLDILISPADVEQALTILRKDFWSAKPTRSDATDQLHLSNWRTKDISLQHKPTGAIIELHWRLNSNPYLMPAAVGESRQTVTLGPVSTETLAPDDLLLYLCVHGAIHYWFRIKWLADVHTLLTNRGPAEIDRFYSYACANGLDVPAGQMLLLLEHVYGMTIPNAIKVSATESWRVRQVTRLALRYLRAVDEPAELRFAPTLMSLGRLLLHRDPRYIALEVAVILIDWPVARRLGETRWAYAVAIIGRPIFWIVRKVTPRLLH